MPPGDGHVILGVACPAGANCDVIACSGRRPVICPKKNSRPLGFRLIGRMPGWRHCDDPEGSCRACHRRSLVEAAFSVTKERFGAVARAKTLAMRELQSVPRCIRCNLVA